MPERWEREVRKLRDVEPREHVIRERAARGPSQERRRPRRNALVAGVVAGAVAIAGVAFLGQLDEDREIGGETPDLPSLLVTFESNGFIVNQPDEQVQRVDTTIVYGDAREESFTSTISANAHVDWAGVDDLTRFVPGPTAGSPVRIEADGENARVLIGTPADWPEFDRFTPIEKLPDAPGDYVLVFEADYPDGIARTARRVHVVTAGVLQLDVTEGKALDAATAAAYVDGRRTDGFLSTSWFTAGDLGGQMEPQAPSFEPGSWIELPSRSPLLLASDATEARAGLFENYNEFDHNDRLPIDLLGNAGVIDGPDGRHLLAVDVSWKHGETGWGHDGTEERALFFFPIEIVPVTAEIPSPTPDTSPTPAPVSTDAVVIDIRRTSEETGAPEAIARFGTQERWMCPDGWTLVNPDGTEESIVFDCGQNDVFLAPVGTPITVAGDFATVNVSTRVSGDRHPGSSDVVPALESGSILTLGYEVTWDDGSEASFWLLLTVSEGSPTAESSVLRMRCGSVGAEVLTPVVAAQPDGVHVEVDNAAGAESLEFTEAVSPDGWFGGPIDGMVRAWPIDPGEYFVDCLERQSDSYQGLETARFAVVDPNGYWVSGTPGCPEDDSLLNVSAYESGGADYVDDETTIRALLHSIEPMDEVRLPFYPEGGGAKDLRYVVVRNERVIATLYVGVSDDQDAHGPGLPEVTGRACASSGIAQGSIG